MMSHTQSEKQNHVEGTCAVCNRVDMVLFLYCLFTPGWKRRFLRIYIYIRCVPFAEFNSIQSNPSIAWHYSTICTRIPNPTWRHSHPRRRRRRRRRVVKRKFFYRLGVFTIRFHRYRQHCGSTIKNNSYNYCYPSILLIRMTVRRRPNKFWYFPTIHCGRYWCDKYWPIHTHATIRIRKRIGTITTSFPIYRAISILSVQLCSMKQPFQYQLRLLLLPRL